MGNKPRAVMIVGDGFSQDLLQYLGLRQKISTHPVIPPAISIPFEADPGWDKPQNVDTLWDERLFPKLWSEWESFSKNNQVSTEGDLSWSFLNYLDKNYKANPDSGADTFTFDTATISWELRIYLYYLFVYYDTIIREQFKLKTRRPKFMDWRWIKPLRYLNEHFDCTFVSFNYDVLLEIVLENLGYKFKHAFQDSTSSQPLTSKQRLLIKPHGSISYVNYAIGITNPFTNQFNRMWGGDNLVVNTTRFHYPPDKHPLFQPDIVPPGHFYTNQIFPTTSRHQDVADILSRAQLVILCGLSANPPDTDEMDLHLRHLPSRCGKIHVGVSGNETNPAGELLRTYGSRDCYRFLTVNSMLYVKLVSAISELQLCI